MCFRRWRLFQKHSICLTQTNDTRHPIYLTRRLPNSWWHCTWLRCRSSWPNGSSSWLSSQGDEWLRINEDGRLKWSAKKFDTKGDPMERMFPKLKLFLLIICLQSNIKHRETSRYGKATQMATNRVREKAPSTHKDGCTRTLSSSDWTTIAGIPSENKQICLNVVLCT